MPAKELHVVIGAGVAGCLSAILRRRAGYQVILLEKERARVSDAFPVCTRTSNIVSENHSGAEYPFDSQSARDCLDGRIVNERFFPELIYGGKTYSRIIASQSMVEDGHDIVAQCRANMDVIRSHYRRRCAEDEANRVFGDPAGVCREVDSVPGVNDVAKVFVTPQRGMNPAYVASLLEWHLHASGVDARSGADVRLVERQGMRYRIEVIHNGTQREEIWADQVSICTASHTFRLMKELNPSLVLPELYLALRQILYVDLPDGCDKTFTCLKLEDRYGGMLSPFNQHVAMVYHPPEAHIMYAHLDRDRPEFPCNYRQFLENGHPDEEARAERSMSRLREYYPELRQSRILGRYLKVALNTVTDSRMRRNMGIFTVSPGCTASVLPKWTMGVVNAQREVSLAIEHSRLTGNLSDAHAAELLRQVSRSALEAPALWQASPQVLVARAARHALNMEIPAAMAQPMRFTGRLALTNSMAMH